MSVFVRRGSPVALSLLALIPLGGCSPTPEDPWAATVADLKEAATTDFEREILADGKVSEAEFAEALAQFTSCMSTAGFTVTVERYKGVYAGFSVDSTEAGVDEATATCAEGRTAVVEVLYNQMRLNPAAPDSDQVLIDCLIERGLVDASYTDTQFLEDISNKALPFDQDSEAFTDCVQGI